MADFDSPWKEALDVYFQAFVLLFFPDMHAEIDWSRPVEMLDKEFQQLVPRAARGRRTVDKLVKVWRRNGRAAWVLIHVEVQAQRDRAFARRLCLYNCRIFDRYDRDAATLAVLADDDPNWRPTEFRRGLWGCSLRMRFPAVKLLDFAGREAELEASHNPFAKIVLAHLKTLETRGNPAERRNWKLRIARGLHECGFSAEDVCRLLNLVDWLMELPRRLERNYQQELDNFVERRRWLSTMGGSARACFNSSSAPCAPSSVKSARNCWKRSRTWTTARSIWPSRMPSCERTTWTPCAERMRNW